MSLPLTNSFTASFCLCFNCFLKRQLCQCFNRSSHALDTEIKLHTIITLQSDWLCQHSSRANNILFRVTRPPFALPTNRCAKGLGHARLVGTILTRVVRNHVDSSSCRADSSSNSNTNQQFTYQHVGFIELYLAVNSLWRLDIAVRTLTKCSFLQNSDY